MKKLFFLLVLASLIVPSCVPATQTPQTEIISVFATPAAQPWLTELYVCAAESSVVLNITAEDPDIYLRVGEPENIVSPIYQIDQEEILIVTNRESSIQNLTLAEAQGLFAQGNASARMWVYSSGTDVQDVFDQLVMKGQTVTSLADVATSPQHMSDLINAEKASVGILPRHWMAGSIRDIFSAGTAPVLAVTLEEPQGALQNLISCLQK